MKEELNKEELEPCDLYGHDWIPILGFDNVVLGDICRQCGLEIK